MEKIFNQKNVDYFVCTPLGSRVNIFINFCLQVHFKESAAWYCFHILPLVSLIPVANLPPVSTTLGKLVAKFATGVIDTSGKFAARVVDIGGAPWLECLREFSRKIWNGPNGILWGWGETDPWKKSEAKNLVTLSH
jgi:hypothetical protein